MRRDFVGKYKLLFLLSAVFIAAAIFVFSFFWKIRDITPSVAPQPPVVVSSTLFTPLPETPAEEEEKLLATSFLFVGDVMLGRYVETLMNQKGSGYPFEKVTDLFSFYDTVIANLEGPIVVAHEQTPNNSLRFSFDPSVAQVLAENAIDAVSLANNHTFDQGEEAFDDMTVFLDRAGVGYFGHPREPAAGDVFIDEFVGDTLLLGFGFHATSSRFDVDAAARQIQEGRENNPDDFLVVSVHWGNEYQLHSNASQQKWAHQFIDAGADLVIGHHPHVVQEVELYNNHLIFYSLGNFIFDQYFSDDTQQELAVGLDPDQEQLTFKLFPLQSERSQPRRMTEDEATSFLKKLAERSSESLSEQIKAGIITLDRQEL